MLHMYNKYTGDRFQPTQPETELVEYLGIYSPQRLAGPGPGPGPVQSRVLVE